MDAAEQIALEPVDSIEILTLIDNVCDLLLAGGAHVRRPSFVAGPKRVDAPLFAEPQLPEMLIAEHGYSALVRVTKGGRTHTVMFDAGLSVGGLAHNMSALDVSLADVEAIVLSHGHFDHVGGLHGLIKQSGFRRLPMLLHPDFWLARRVLLPTGAPFEMPVASRAAIEGAGFEVIAGAAPSLLLDGSVLITGEVSRKTEFERGFPTHQAMRGGEWTADPLILDDQALIANVAGKGLVVVTGCGHAGVVNIVRHAQRLTGEDRVYAIIGGFHLAGPLFEPVVPQTIAALAGFGPELIAPGHCTGPVATRAIADQLPQAYVPSSAGTRYVL